MYTNSGLPGITANVTAYKKTLLNVVVCATQKEKEKIKKTKIERE